MRSLSLKSSLAIFFAWLTFSNCFLEVVSKLNYKDALSKSILFLEAQRSGKLPRNKRIPWRGDSGLTDGKLSNVDLVGGYYDAGDNVKYGLPMAFTITTLAWAAIAYESEMKQMGELGNLHSAIKWGTDYFLKASHKKNRLWVQVGDPVKDHECWTRPENMRTPRTLYLIDEHVPGTEIAAETAAAMAASSIVFRKYDHLYSRRLLNKAKLLFEFANKYKKTYDGECPFYCSYSGYNDELLWASTWLYLATKKGMYRRYIIDEAVSASVAEFSWDLKYPGAQILLSELHFSGFKGFGEFNIHADNFICAVLPESPNRQVFFTPGGLINLRDGANTQYVTSTAFLFSVYSDILKKHKKSVRCGSQVVHPDRIMHFAKQQMDYLLGNNPQRRSYMVGFGKNSPKQAHHRGASVPVLSPQTEVNCGMSFNEWFNNDRPNPNELTGAIVGGPDRQDKFIDKRSQSSMLEPCTYINSLAVGVLAKLAAHSS
ncbi:endoglucanase 8 [Dioscorea cayenensis subsp. rotundata]|uniref:Endoglucanase n=1 Tax=Dioscorea cayennensis subsp. rotundata TaxID=55577 RepID=A0AB40CXK6_DIOCR|nr:endoglucanase 8 [Dioscorea cayenensis subsp. rotundata]